jgi:choline kinase
MSISKAIVLAAGVGSRLRPFTADRPKCLVEVGGRTLIEHQLRALRACGVEDVVMVVGYCADRVRRQVGGAVRYIENERYEATNSLYSLSLASAELSSGVLILNSDVLAVPILFDRLMRAPDPTLFWSELGNNFEPEDMKVELRESHVVNFGEPAGREHARPQRRCREVQCDRRRPAD